MIATRQDLLELWYAAYLNGEYDLFAECESALCQLDKGVNPENIEL